MEMVKTYGFCEISNDDLESVNGGAVPFLVGLGIGVLASWAADGILLATTGKSGADWVSTGIKAGYNWIKSWF